VKQELLKKITPIIEDCIDNVLGTFSDLDKIRKQLVNDQRRYQDLCEEKEREVIEIKIEKSTDRKERDQKITELENAKDGFVLKEKSYTDLSNDLKSKQKKIIQDLARADIEFVRANEVRAQTEYKLDEANRLKADYELKLESLKKDSQKILEDNQKIEAEKKKLTSRENDNFKNETRNSEKAQELNESDKKVKADRYEVNRLIKLYKLKV